MRIQLKAAYEIFRWFAGFEANFWAKNGGGIGFVWF